MNDSKRQGVKTIRVSKLNGQVISEITNYTMIIGNANPVQMSRVGEEDVQQRLVRRQALRLHHVRAVLVQHKLDAARLVRLVVQCSHTRHV
jgi:hypothetical protein